MFDYFWRCSTSLKIEIHFTFWECAEKVDMKFMHRIASIYLKYVSVMKEELHSNKDFSINFIDGSAEVFIVSR